MERVPNNLVAIGDCVFCRGFPGTMEVHAVIEDVIAELEILVPHCVGANCTIDAMIGIANGDPGSFVRYLE